MEKPKPIQLNYDDGRRDPEGFEVLLRRAASLDALLMIIQFPFCLKALSCAWFSHTEIQLAQRLICIGSILVMYELLFKKSVGMTVYNMKIYKDDGSIIGCGPSALRVVMKYWIFTMSAFWVLWATHKGSPVFLESRYLVSPLHWTTVILIIGSFFVNAFGWGNMMQGRKAFHDWICGTKVGE